MLVIVFKYLLAMKLVQHYTFNILLIGFCLLSNHAIASIQIDPSQDKPFVVVLDAGHGGKDSGNRGNGYYEKKIALNIILQIGKILEKKPNLKAFFLVMSVRKNESTFQIGAFLFHFFSTDMTRKETFKLGSSLPVSCYLEKGTSEA